jgi:hypothetical protein
MEAILRAPLIWIKAWIKKIMESSNQPDIVVCALIQQMGD